MLLIKDQIIINNKKDVMLIHLYIKCKQFNINISDGIRELLYHIYEMGGIESEKDFNELSKICIENTSIKTKNSVRNTISKCVMLDILENKGKYNKQLSSEWVPNIIEDVIGLEYKITNFNNAV